MDKLSKGFRQNFLPPALAPQEGPTALTLQETPKYSFGM